MIVILTAAVVVFGGGTIFCAVRSTKFRKFLAGAFFVVDGIQFYMYLASVSVPLLSASFVRTPELSRARSIVHVVLLRSRFTSVSLGQRVTPSDRLPQSDEGEEALAGHEPLRPRLGEARLLHLRHELVRRGQRPTARRRCRPEVEQLHRRAPALAAGGDEQPPTGAEE